MTKSSSSPTSSPNNNMKPQFNIMVEDSGMIPTRTLLIHLAMFVASCVLIVFAFSHIGVWAALLATFVSIRFGTVRFPMLVVAALGISNSTDAVAEALKRCDTMAQPNSKKHTYSGKSTNCSGGGVYFACTSMQGWRRSMEDAHSTVLDLKGAFVTITTTIPVSPANGIGAAVLEQSGGMSSFESAIAKEAADENTNTTSSNGSSSTTPVNNGSLSTPVFNGQKLSGFSRSNKKHNQYQHHQKELSEAEAVGLATNNSINSLTDGMTLSSSQASHSTTPTAHHQQPTVTTVTTTVQQLNSYFAVFDGHSGPTIAQFCGNMLPQFLTDTEQYKKGKYAEAMRESYINIDKHLSQHPTFRDDRSGCTAVSVLVTQNEIICANAGDSRAVLCRNGKAIPLSIDHKPTLPGERKRIERAKSIVHNKRVNGILALSRAIGDFSFKRRPFIPWEEQAVTCVPDVVSAPINRDADEFVIIACDGIWDVLSNEAVVTFIRTRLQKGIAPATICESLMDACLSTGPFGLGCDNMSVILVLLKGNHQLKTVVDKEL